MTKVDAKSLVSMVICFTFLLITLSQTSFSLYFYNQWTNFHKLSCTEKP